MVGFQFLPDFSTISFNEESPKTPKEKSLQGFIALGG